MWKKTGVAKRRVLSASVVVLFATLAVGLLLVALGGLPSWTHASANESELPHVTTAKEAWVPEGECERARIHLTVTGAGEPIEEREPLDVMLVLDRSGTMDDAGATPPQPLTDVKEAAKKFINALDPNLDRIGLVSYASYASLDQGLTNDFNAVKGAINGMSANGSSNIGDGVLTAQMELDNRTDKTPEAIVVLFSDGGVNRRGHWPFGGSCVTWPTIPNSCTQFAEDQAAEAKARGTIIFIIGFGLEEMGYEHGEDVEDLARSVLQTMAGPSPGGYYEAPTSSELEPIVDEITTIITTVFGLAGTASGGSDPLMAAVALAVAAPVLAVIPISRLWRRR